MKRVVGTLLLAVFFLVPLTGCVEEVLLPTDRGGFDITIDQLVDGLEERRLERIENIHPTREGDKKSLNFKKREIDGIEIYTATAKNAGIKVEAFCTGEEIYAVRISGDANKQNILSTDSNIKVYGQGIAFLLLRDIHTPQGRIPDRIENYIDEQNIFTLSNGEVKDLEGNGIVYHVERKGNTTTAVLTPTATRKALGLNR